MISLTIELTRNFNVIHQINENRHRRRMKISSDHLINSPNFISHLSTIIHDDQLHLNSSMKIPLKWKLDQFENSNAPIIFLAYKNRKWKNSNHLVTIHPTAEKNIYSITCVIFSKRIGFCFSPKKLCLLSLKRNFFDRLILIRSRSNSINEEIFDQLLSMKLFTCVLARNPSLIDHYALVIVPIQKQNFAEELLRKRNYTQIIVEQLNNHLTRSSFDYSNKYLYFCASEGTYVTQRDFQSNDSKEIFV